MGERIHKILDLFCGAGGAAMGIYRAYEKQGRTVGITGIDIKHQKRYPFTFIQGDALEVDVANYDAVWASPPCQQWAMGYNPNRSDYPDLVEPTRILISSKLHIIENVIAAPLRNWVFICGGALGCWTDELQLHRHRHFESNVGLLGVPCARQKRLTIAVTGDGTPTGNRERLGRNLTIAEKREAMGIDWMTGNELTQAVPPAYSEHLWMQVIPAIDRMNMRS